MALNLRNFNYIIVKLIIFLMMFCFIGVGCGDDNDNESKNVDDNITTTTKINGKVADGYLDNAKVCLDINTNGKCDQEEPNTLSEDGDFSLTITKADKNKYPIVVEILAGETTDLDDNSIIEKSYVLTAPKEDTDFISPVTTLIKSEIDKNPALTKDEAVSKVANKLNLTTDNTMLLKDYVANTGTDYKKIHEVGKIIAQLLGEINDKISNELGITLSDNQENGLRNILTDIVIQNIGSIAVKIKNGMNSSELTDEIKTVVERTNIDADDLTTAVKQVDLNKDSTVKKFSDIIGSVFFGFEHNDDNDIEIEAAVFRDGYWMYGRSALSNGINSVDLSENNIDINNDDTDPYTVDSDGNIIYTDENIKHPRFALISLQGKTYTVKEMINILDDGHSVKLNELDESKLSNEINFTDENDKFYRLVVNKKSSNEHITVIYKVSKSAMGKIVAALQ